MAAEPETMPSSQPANLQSHETEVTRLRDLSPLQWRSGIAAWLGWAFDGLDMHLYTLVAAPFVAQLISATTTTDPMVGKYGSWIQGAFLLGWALGGGFFGRIGDKIGRSRALSLTILTYACFTGLSFFAQEWWHLLIFRFVAALGIGGEWAVGASLLSETWPKRWRPWIAAVLQTGVNVGILAASFANLLLAAAPPRYLFLVGVLPALLVFWIRRAVPEPAEWQLAKSHAAHHEPRTRDLFKGEVLRITVWVIIVCAISLTAHWAFMFWHQQHLRNLPDVLNMSAEQKNRLASTAMYIVIGSSILGNFLAAGLARSIGYRGAIGSFLPRLLRSDARRLQCSPGSRVAALVVSSHWALSRWICAVYDVFAASVPDTASDNRCGFLLQHRTSCRCIWHGLLRFVFKGWRPSWRAALRWMPLFARRDYRVFPASPRKRRPHSA